MKEANEIVCEMTLARLRAGLTQGQLAKKMRTSQPTISRLERGRNLPTITTLQRLADVTGHRLEVRLVAAQPSSGTL